jgi:glycosyltransferase involved in cell wall biosynthesis
MHGLRESAETAGIVSAAITDFRDLYGEIDLPSLLIVIPALNEEHSIGRVLAEIPPVIANIPAKVIVIDDGSTDGTFSEATAHGALVARLAENCGQGVAFRLGYRIGREAGVRYLATLDADGQWNPADLPGMIELLETDTADFVIGSRVLGATDNTDVVRNIGVRLFAFVIRAVTKIKVTDTSSGLRAFRAEVTGQVRQTQPQYQTSELLIGAAFHGYRIVEVPTVMRVRTDGISKKGHNIFYGARYATVILATTIREWRTRRRERRLSRRVAR